MSKYTTELRFICEMKSGYSEEELAVKPIADIIEAARPAVFNFQYPIYDTTHKQDLETKIIKHYYTREIAAETYALWNLWLNSRMNDIMPKYNKLYQWEHDILNKELHNIDVTYESERTDDLLRTDSFTRTDNLSEEIDSTRTDNLSEDTDSTRTDNLSEEIDSTRTDNLSEEIDSTRTDNLSDDSDVTRTDNLREQSTSTRTDNLKEDITASDIEKRKFSDTPQGSVSFNDELDQGNYWLTDYTETTRETESERTNTGTQATVSDTTNTGTQRTLGTVDHTGTQRTLTSRDNTGTQRTQTERDNTGTQRTQTSRDNTGTQRTQTERDNTGTQTNAGTSANTGTQETLTHEYGYRGSKTYMELLAEYKDKILNIDLMIIRELNDLFFMLW